MPRSHHDELEATLERDGTTVVECLDHWAQARSEKTFFYYGEDDVSLTFAEFGERTDAIAGNLARLGIGRGEPVSVYSTNSFVCALVMFGIWKAGAVYAPVNFSYTGRLLTYQLNDTKPRLLITDPGLLGAVNDIAAEVENGLRVCVYEPPAGAHDHGSTRGELASPVTDVPWAELTAPAPRPHVSVAYDDPANIVYTSGTTGPAKGVVQPHRWMNQYTYTLRVLLTADDVIYNDLPLYHVGGAVENVVRAAWVGCEVAVWNRFSPHAFWERIAQRGASTAILLDVMIPWLTHAPISSTDNDNTLNKVYMQPLPASHAQVAQRFGFDVVTAGFGQTESGNPLGVLIEETEPGAGTPERLYQGLSRAELLRVSQQAGMPIASPQQATGKGLLGLPTPFVDVTVLDDRDAPCAENEVGELAVRPKLPAVLMSEYRGKPEATVQAWRNLWFHTGDAATRRDDGMFAFVDRLGDRMRVRGENLSSFQVEDLLHQHPGISLAAVFPLPGDEGDEDDVVAFVTIGHGHELSAQELHEYAAQSMPKHMRPRHIRIVEEIPRTPTNKIEKYKLRKQIVEELSGQQP